MFGRRKRGTRRVTAGVGVGLMAATLTALPAMAEGSWNSSLSSVRAGFSSRSWQDSHLDSDSTVATLSGCSGSGLTLNLYDEYGALPDQSIGRITHNCGAFNWGTMTRPDQYHWTVDSVSSGSFSATSVKQTY